MRKFLFVDLVLLYFASATLSAQDTVYLDVNLEKVEDAATEFEYFNVEVKSPKDSNSVMINHYFRSGALKSEDAYYPYYPASKRKQIGESKEWYESGKLKWIVNYVKGKKHGEVRSYWENGQIKRKDIYSKGEFKKGTTWDEYGNETKHFPFFEIASCDAWSAYLQNNLKYPSNARNALAEGRVVVKFVVTRDGSVSNVKIIKSVHPDLDAEVIRLIYGTPIWKPAKLDGEAAPMFIAVPITFKLG